MSTVGSSSIFTPAAARTSLRDFVSTSSLKCRTPFFRESHTHKHTERHSIASNCSCSARICLQSHQCSAHSTSRPENRCSIRRSRSHWRNLRVKRYEKQRTKRQLTRCSDFLMSTFARDECEAIGGSLHSYEREIRRHYSTLLLEGICTDMQVQERGLKRTVHWTVLPRHYL